MPRAIKWMCTPKCSTSTQYLHKHTHCWSRMFVKPVNRGSCWPCSCLYTTLLLEGGRTCYWLELMKPVKVLWWRLTVFTSPDRFLLHQASLLWKTAAVLPAVRLLSHCERTLCASFRIFDRNERSGFLWGIPCYGLILSSSCRYWIYGAYRTEAGNLFKVFSIIPRVSLLAGL